MRKLVTGPRLIFSLVLFAAVVWLVARNLPDGRLHIWFLDVGQGDAILIQTPDGQQILVDGGPSPSALFDELGAVLPFWDRSLDLVVLTHPDADHASGLVPLFERFEIAAAVDSIAPGEKGAEAWLAAMHAAGVTRQPVAAGTRIEAGDVTLTVLSPCDPLANPDDGNDGSVVLRLDYGASSVLLTGDAEAAAEQTMLAGLWPLRADVLKVGHHGSAGSTSADFLRAVAPSLAVISVGADNRFGHPAPELLQRLGGIMVLRTDERGRIELVSDGMKWSVHTER